MEQKNRHREAAKLIADTANCELTLIMADRALDDGRRLIYIRAFSGTPMRDLIRALGTSISDNAFLIASKLESDFSPSEGMEIIEEARTLLWMDSYSRIPDSRFARQVEAARRNKAAAEEATKH